MVPAVPYTSVETFTACFHRSRFLLMEGALGERLKREYGLVFHEQIAMAALIETKEGQRALHALWDQYRSVAQRYGFPFLATTPTRRANRERISLSGYSDSLLAENMAFLKAFQHEKARVPVFAGALMGCRGDAYTGEGALCEEEAFHFHRWSAARFRDAGADFLYAGIMPTLPEGSGMARALSETGLPYIISFTLQRDGRLIDGTPLFEAISYIDENGAPPPLCYMANCVHPRIVREAIEQPFNQCDLVFQRFLGIQANTSSLPYAELDGAVRLQVSDPEELASETERLLKKTKIKIFGGCCGTDVRHMEQIAKMLRSNLPREED